MVVLRHAPAGGVIHLPEHQEKERCAEDGNPLHAQENDAGALAETLLPEVLAYLCCLMRGHLPSGPPSIWNQVELVKRRIELAIAIDVLTDDGRRRRPTGDTCQTIPRG